MNLAKSNKRIIVSVVMALMMVVTECIIRPT